MDRFHESHDPILAIRQGLSVSVHTALQDVPLEMGSVTPNTPQGLGLMSLFGDLFDITFKYLLEIISPILW